MKQESNQNIPRHLGIILDGNRRWAKERNLSSFEGHRQGFENIKTIGSHAFERGIKIMTVFAFSTENWKRSVEEVSYLMGLFKMVAKKVRYGFEYIGYSLIVIKCHFTLSENSLR